MHNDARHPHRTLATEPLSFRKAIITGLVLLLVVAVCVLPMGLLPIWNGEIPDHRNQYELMAESILEGRIEFAYGDENALQILKNPYDPTERNQAEVPFHWDHAYYDGHYYMYFGIVPVFLVFLPYRILTGAPLTTYHATQFFVTLIIVGFFALFYHLRRVFFRELPFYLYLILSATFSVISVWYSVAEPALYCTAITAGIALEIWSVYFFAQAVWGELPENRKFLFFGIGSLLGALAFGCRPPIALANLLVLPLLIFFLKQRPLTAKNLGKLAAGLLPYVVVAVLLMVYNYARFDNPFEFGQTYQLTVADQTQYRLSMDAATLVRLINSTVENFFAISHVSSTFPYLRTSGVFYNFPVLWLSLAGLCVPAVLTHLKKSSLLPVLAVLLFITVLISCIDTLYTPYLLERYRMDVYFLVCIVCYIVVGVWYKSSSRKHRCLLVSITTVLSTTAIVSACFFTLYTIAMYYPEKVQAIADALSL